MEKAKKGKEKAKNQNLFSNFQKFKITSNTFRSVQAAATGENKIKFLCMPSGDSWRNHDPFSASAAVAV